MPKLIVVVPSIRDDVRDWTALIDRLAQEPALSDARWLRVPHGVTWWSRITPDAVALQVQARINQEWIAHGPFDEVILVGHSFGGLLVREAYLRASGADPTFPQKAAWAAAVKRIILFSAINRGINPEEYLSVRIFSWAARFMPPLRKMLGWYVLRGGFFITNLRIRWMRHFASLESPPVIVQLRGANDRLVGREDSFDMEQFPTAYYIEVPRAVHKDLFRLDVPGSSDARYALLRDAFVHPVPRMAENKTVEGANKVVLVVHGIRADNKAWVEQVSTILKQEWPGVTAIPMEYREIRAASFAMPITRRKRLREFQDAYSDALAKNPKAEFNFLGHSNGTYLLGESLKSIPGLCFNNVVLVGSVLPQDFPWRMIFDRGQVKRLRVDGSQKDWPVGWLCAVLRSMGQKSVGTGGYVDFSWNPPTAGLKEQFFWYKGGHGAPLAESNLPALATFAVTGEAIRPPEQVLEKLKSGWFDLISRALAKLSGFVMSAAIVATLVREVRASSPRKLLEHAVGAAAGIAGVIVVLDLI